MAYKKRYKSKAGKKKRLSKAAERQLIATAVGKNRPALEEGNLGLIKVFNWYNTQFDDPMLAFNAVIAYTIDKGYDDTTRRMNGCKREVLKYLNSVDWALADMIMAGEAIETAVINRWHRRLKQSLASAERLAKIDATPVKLDNTKNRADQIIGEIESEIDKCFEAICRMKKRSVDVAALYAEYGVSPAHQEYIAAYYKPKYQEMVDVYKGRITEGFEQYKPVQIKALAELYKSFILADGHVTKKQRTVVRKPRAVKVKKTYGKGKKVRGVKAPPPAFHGKPAAIIYYPGQKQVAVLFAEDKKTLELRRKTICNVDESRSFMKRFGRQRQMMSSLKRSKFDKVLKFVDTSAGTKLPITTRFRDGAEIINIKD